MSQSKEMGGIMAANVPTWGPWTTYFDSAGVAPRMEQSVTDDGFAVTFDLTGTGLSLVIGGEDASVAGAAGLAGALPVDFPKEYDLAGFRLAVNLGDLAMSRRSEALFTCSIGHSSTSMELPPSFLSDFRRDQTSPVAGSFEPECFTGDENTIIGGTPLPPLPITLSMQARSWGANEFVNMQVTRFTVQLLLGSIPPAPGGQGGGASNGR